MAVVAEENTLEFYRDKKVKIFTASGYAYDGTIEKIGTDFFTFTNDMGIKSLIRIKAVDRIQIEKGGK